MLAPAKSSVHLNTPSRRSIKFELEMISNLFKILAKKVYSYPYKVLKLGTWNLKHKSRKVVQKYIVRKDFWILFPRVGMEGKLTFQKEYRDQHISHGFLNAFLHLIICEKVTVKRSFYRPHLRSEKLDFVSSLKMSPFWVSGE